MEIIHDLFKLKIETTDSSSSQEEEEEMKRNWLELPPDVMSSEEEEEEVKRNWLELPPDVMSLIFLKLGYVYILGSAQWVCSSWWKLSKQPHLFRSIHVEKFCTKAERSLKIYPLNFTTKFSEGLAREAIERSCGQLVDFSIRGIPIDELLQYMSENPFRSSSLRCLRLVNVRLREVYGDRLLEVAKKLPHLEELGIIKCSDFSKDVIETFGRFCPQLKSCRLNFVRLLWTEGFRVALVIAENMPELRHLNLFGTSLTDDDDLRAILDGCPHLESLDLRECFDVDFGGDLKERCKNIKVLRLPYDPTDDFEYDDIFYDEYDGMSSESSDDYIFVTDCFLSGLMCCVRFCSFAWLGCFVWVLFVL